nr:phosphatidylethanolamine-binding protein [Colletotrichum truncatum]KAF6781255.1 phosphatidylethanolamine-binding protein [Colletotrichum truncatum]
MDVSGAVVYTIFHAAEEAKTGDFMIVLSYPQHHFVNIIETLQSPTISFNPEPRYDPATTKYTYIQVDPDAPGPALPARRKFLHHIVYDLQPSCITTQTPITQVDYQPLLPLSFTLH